MKKVLCVFLTLLIILPSMCCAELTNEERISGLEEAMTMSLNVLKSINAIYSTQPEIMSEKDIIMVYEYYQIYITAYEMSRIEKDDSGSINYGTLYIYRDDITCKIFE